MANPAKEILFSAERALEDEAERRIEAEFANVREAFRLDPEAAVREAMDGLSQLALQEFLPRVADVAVRAADRMKG